jgi:hypothetical protein
MRGALRGFRAVLPFSGREIALLLRGVIQGN